MPHERCRQLTRALAVIRTLERARVGFTLAELATELGVCERTIRRDLAAIETAGYPLVQDDRRYRFFEWRKEAA